MSKRTINLGGGNYNAHIEGNYVEGREKSSDSAKEAPRQERNITEESEVINTGGRNFTENLGGQKVNRIH